MSPIRIGIVGCGYWGPNLIRAFAAQEDVRVTVAADKLEENRTKISALWPDITMVSKATDVFINPEIDAVIIATPASTHVSLVTEALEHGKHVVVEKPLALNGADADRLCALAKKQDRVLMVDHTYLFSEPVMQIKKLIGSGELGTVLHYSSTRANLGLLQRDMNVLWDLGPHDLAILSALRQDLPVRVSATASAHVGTQQEIASIHLEYQDGFAADIRLSWLSPIKQRLVLVHGSKKSAVFDDTSDTPLQIHDKNVTLETDAQGTTHPAYHQGEATTVALEKREPLQTMAAHFIDCIRTKKTPTSSAELGKSIVLILEAATKSLAAGGASVPLSA